MRNRTPENEIHDIVRKKLVKGPSNMGGSDPLLFELSTFGRIIADYMFKRVEHHFSLDKDSHKIELHLLDHACHALMGEVYETGSCGQHASIALLEYLKRGVDNPVEYIQFFGVSHGGHDVNHAVVMTGRNADYSYAVNKWGRFNVIDAWSDNSFSYPDAALVSNASLSYPRQFYDFFKSINGVYFNCRFEKNITSQQWGRLVEFFKFLSNFNEDNFNAFLGARSSDINSSRELSLIHEKIRQYISIFSGLAAHPHVDQVNAAQKTDNGLKIVLPVIHSVGYQVGLFQSVSEKHELPHGLSSALVNEGVGALSMALSDKPLPGLSIL